MEGIRLTTIAFDKLFRRPELAGKTDAAIARLIGLETATVKKMRRREDVPFDAIGRICHVLECQPGDIMEAETVYLVSAKEKDPEDD